MGALRTIHVDWETGIVNNGTPNLRQFDHQSVVVVLDNYPKLDSYWLITKEYGEVELEGPSWLITNEYTQEARTFEIQFCARSNSRDIEVHSGICTIKILPSIEHTTEEVTHG